MPTLDIAALEKQVSQRRLGPLYVIHGDDVRTVMRLVEAIEATIDPADRPFAVDRMHAAEDGGRPIDIASAARIFPMLGDRRLVIVLRAERLLKPKRQGKAGERDDDAVEVTDAEEAESAEALDLAPLEEYIAAPSPSTTVVFVASEIDRSRRFSKRLVEAAEVVDCRGLTQKGDRGRIIYDRREAERQARDAIRAAGRSIEPAGLARLVDAAGTNISKLRDDIGRLLLFADERATITAADVAEVTSGDGVIDDWGVTNAIAAGRVAEALVEVGRRFDRGDSPHQMIGQLRWWATSQLAVAAPERVRPAVDALIRTDLALKSSGGDGRVLLERLVAELTGAPLPPSRGYGRY